MNNIVKKVIAVITVAIIVIRIFTFNIFAFVAAPVTATSIEALLEVLLAAMGVSQSEIDSMSFEEKRITMRTNLDFNGGNISSPDFLKLLSGAGGLYATKEFLDFYNSIESQAARDVTYAFLKSWFKEQFSDYEVLKEVLAEQSNSDMKGYGAFVIFTDDYSSFHYYYADYIVVDVSSGEISFYNPSGKQFLYEYYNRWGEFQWDSYSDYLGSSNRFSIYSWGIDRYKFYGDVRYTDGSDYPTDDSVSIPDSDTVIGELPDGTKVTIGDLIGTDGTVDGVFPDIDWSIFDPSAIADMINDLLDRYRDEADKRDSSDLTDSVADSVEDIIGDSAIELEGLEGLMLPTSIVHVFPFCLPFDFVQGMYLFEAEPEVPHFDLEINIPAFLNVPDLNWKFEIDLSRFETLAKITRWLSMISFVYTLILLTGKIVKGAGA